MPSESRLAIETSGLSKRFRARAAVADVDLAVPAGSVFGFLGPNGSGKTTTIRMLLGLAAASAGRISLLGEEMPRAAATVLPRVGALVEGPAFYPYLSGAANLNRLDHANPFATRVSRARRVADALDRVGLTSAARKKVGEYSLGMKQRLGIANALLMPRDLLVLDEPTNGLDPQGTREVRNLVRTLADDGTTVFVSSHLLSEVEQVCSHIAVLSAGRLVAQGRVDALRSNGSATVDVRTPDVARASAVLERLGMHPAADTAAGLVRSRPAEPAVRPEDIVSALVADGVRVRGFSIQSASLEERFVELTGEGFDVAQ